MKIEKNGLKFKKILKKSVKMTWIIKNILILYLIQYNSNLP